MENRKVLFTNGMSNDAMIIITDAPKERLEQFCREYNEDMENGVNVGFDRIKTQYYVKELFDSEIDDRELIEVIGYSESYDINDYYAEDTREELAEKFTDAIVKLADNPMNLDNLESYLSHHFDVWMKKFANSPEGLVSEIKSFAEMEI